MKIGPKLTLYFFLVAFGSMAVVGIIAYQRAKASLREESYNRLTAIREMKASQIEDYFQFISDQISTFAQDRMIVYATKKFEDAFTQVYTDLQYTQKKLQTCDSVLNHYYQTDFLPRLQKTNSNVSINYFMEENKNAQLLQYLYIADNPNPVGKKHELIKTDDSCTYSKVHENFHPVIKEYLEKFGYYDIFIVDIETGNVVYSVFKEVDFASSLTNGPFKNSHLTTVFNEIKSSTKKDFVYLEDFKPYIPSFAAPTAFIGSPIYDGEKKIGALIFQLPINKINNIMTNKHQWSTVGLGKTGETYIVGDDFTLRNQSRFLIENPKSYFKTIRQTGTSKETIEKIKIFNSSIGLQKAVTLGTKAALKGETNTQTFADYRGVEVLSAYRPLNINGLHWVMMSEIDVEEAFSHVFSLRKFLLVAFSCLVALILIVSYFVSHNITKPLKELTYDTREIAKGNMDVAISIKRKDEIGILALSFKKMQIAIKNLVNDLRHINQNLENKVVERTIEINQQKEMVEEKNREIVDSINYAKRLQTAILPTASSIQQSLKDSFILFKPKDIVSGDFYWMHKYENSVLLAVVDCTGHGVPGAMVSVVGANSLNRCVKEFGLKQPNTILDKLTEMVIETFETDEHEVKDGMDIGLCHIHLNERKIEFAGANNPLWIVKSNTLELIEVKADKQPIGKFDHHKAFTLHEIQLEEGDCVYMFSDGYADQFGGPGGKKFKYKSLTQVLQRIHNKPMHEQKEILNAEFESWKGTLEQVDDVCVLGVKMV